MRSWEDDLSIFNCKVVKCVMKRHIVDKYSLFSMDFKLQFGTTVKPAYVVTSIKG